MIFLGQKKVGLKIPGFSGFVVSRRDREGWQQRDETRLFAANNHQALLQVNVVCLVAFFGQSVYSGHVELQVRGCLERNRSTLESQVRNHMRPLVVNGKLDLDSIVTWQLQEGEFFPIWKGM